MNIPLRAATSQEVLYESTQAQIRGVRNLLARNLQCWGIDYRFVSTVDAEERRQGIRDVGTIIALLEDAQDSRSRISQRVDMDSQRVDLLMGDMMTLQETVWMVKDEAYASREAWVHSIGLSQGTHLTYTHAVHETLFQFAGWSKQRFRETDRRRQAQMVETLRVIRDMRREMSDMQAELLALSKQQGELDSQDQS
ncbi:hypothetical protein Tco_1403476 [Tanacetum coccineum]